jgi:predicted transcriptional regulator
MLETDQELKSFTGFAGTAVRLLNDSKRTNQAISVSINGKLSLAIEDDTSFRMLLELAERLETMDAIRQGLKELEEGKGLTLDEVKEGFRAKYGTAL